jgi:hypothetical protein
MLSWLGLQMIWSFALLVRMMPSAFIKCYPSGCQKLVWKWACYPEMHEAKSRCITAGGLGFWRLKYTSRKDSFATKLKGMRHYLRQNLNSPDTVGTVKTVIRVVKGWVNYHAISDNGKRVSSFLREVKRILWKWFNRRGGNRRFTWNNLLGVLWKN